MKFNTGVKTRTRKQVATGGGSSFGRNYAVVEVHEVEPNKNGTNNGFIIGTLPYGKDPEKKAKYIMNQESYTAATKSAWAKDSDFMGGMIDTRMKKFLLDDKVANFNEATGNTKALVIMEGVAYVGKDKESGMDIFETRYINNVPSSSPNKIINGVLVARSKYDPDGDIAQIKHFGYVLSSDKTNQCIQAHSLDDDFTLAGVLDSALVADKEYKDNYAFILRANARLAESIPTQSAKHSITHVVAHQTPPLWFIPQDEPEDSEHNNTPMEFHPLTGDFLLTKTAEYAQAVEESSEELMEWLRQDGYDPVSIQPEIIFIRLFNASPKFRKFKLNPEKDKSPFFRMTHTYTGLDFNENPDEAGAWKGLNYGGFGTLVITDDDAQIIRGEPKVVEINIVANAFLQGYVGSIHDFVAAADAQEGEMTRLAKSLTEVEQYRPGEEQNEPDPDDATEEPMDSNELDGVGLHF